MPERAFKDKSPMPDAGLLAEVLGKSASRWEAVARFVETEHGPIQWEWKHYSSGWTLKALQSKKRNLFFLVPMEGAFQLAFVFGDKAVAALEKADGVPAAVVAELKAARKYAEGRGLRLDVKAARDVETVKALVKAKVETR
ncbi:MAG: DUF3788 family protein [Deltaproteobacteria bacterium]|nr:DUF3788 family protein [Deltaproteobacteria bacterium]